MILFLHHRYRTLGGEERVVDDLAWLVREHLNEDVEVLARDSTATSPARAAAGLLRGGLEPDEVTRAVRRTSARVVHAHNLNPTFGPRALEAARAAGARTVLHLHNYRLVCAVATCVDPQRQDCTRCRGRDTRPGVRLNCRGSLKEAVPYAVALAAYQRRLVAAADVVVVPSEAALARLREVDAPLEHADVRVVGHVVRDFADASHAAQGRHALVASRLAPEKGVDAAIAAAAAANVPLVVAGDGPLRAALTERASGHDVTFLGHVDAQRVRELRAQAALEIVATRAAETFGLSAVEAMAAGVPVVATRAGALEGLAPEALLVAPGDDAALADAIPRAYGDQERGERSIARARALAEPSAVARRLAAVYG